MGEDANGGAFAEQDPGTERRHVADPDEDSVPSGSATNLYYCARACDEMCADVDVDGTPDRAFQCR